MVSTHPCYSEETRKIIGEPEFKLMRRDAVFVNTSRGKIVDEAALVEAVRPGEITGAVLDVYEQVSLPSDSPLPTLSNTVLTPHIGGMTGGTYEKIHGVVVE